MKKYYVSVKSKVILGFMCVMPYILTKLSFVIIWGWIKSVLQDSFFWVSDATMDSNPLVYYPVSVVHLIAWLIFFGLLIAPFDDRLDKTIKKIPLVSWIYGVWNQLFTVKKTPKGVPIVLNIYGSEYCNVVCFIPSFQKRWLYVTQRKKYCWCYTLVPPPNGNPIGGHDEHAPCDIIDQEMVNQYANMSFDELIAYCVSFGMSFPDKLTQQNDEEIPAWVIEKQKQDKIQNVIGKKQSHYS